MTYVYGPVPSRRLGRSLGIDPVPFKTCTRNCIYCQLGRTSLLSTARREHFPAAEIVAEVKSALDRHRPSRIDWLTFAGSGEPTLHASLGWMIRQLKTMTELPIGVITDGSLLHLPEVRRELCQADAVLPSLDAGNETLYRKINRPAPKLDYQRFVDGLVAFREQFNGKLWVEVMLIKGLNDTPAALRELASVLDRIRPNEVHINLPVRPPCEAWVEPADRNGVTRAKTILGEVAHVVHPVPVDIDLSGSGNIIETVIGIIQRHPMREEELIKMLDRWSNEEVVESLKDLERSKHAQVIMHEGHRCWSFGGARYVDGRRS